MIGASVTRIVIYSTRKIVSVNALKAWCIGDKAPLILSLYITYRGQIHTQAALLPGGRDTGTHWIGSWVDSKAGCPYRVGMHRSYSLQARPWGKVQRPEIKSNKSR